MKITARFAFAIIVFGVSARAQSSWFTPTRVLAAPGSGMSAPFTLRLFNRTYNCADTFSQVSAKVSNRVITLTYREHKSTMVCPGSNSIYGPAFSIPSLSAGYYEVQWLFYSDPCTGPLCELTAPPVPVGFLSVAEDTSWLMKPDTVAANAPFTLELQNQAYGNCLVGYPHARIDTVSAKLTDGFYLEFSEAYFPAKGCATDPHPSGPRFSMSGLPPGRYPILPWERPACDYDSIACSNSFRPFLALDTLVVIPSSAILPEKTERKTAMKFSGPLDAVQGYRINGRSMKKEIP